MAALRVRVQIARGHVFDHRLAQRCNDVIGNYRELLSIQVADLDLQDIIPANLMVVTKQARSLTAAGYRAAI